MEWIACLAVHAQYLNAQMGNAGNNDAGTGKGGGYDDVILEKRVKPKKASTLAY